MEPLHRDVQGCLVGPPNPQHEQPVEDVMVRHEGDFLDGLVRSGHRGDRLLLGLRGVVALRGLLLVLLVLLLVLLVVRVDEDLLRHPRDGCVFDLDALQLRAAGGRWRRRGHHGRLLLDHLVHLLRQRLHWCRLHHLLLHLGLHRRRGRLLGRGEGLLARRRMQVARRPRGRRLCTDRLRTGAHRLQVQCLDRRRKGGGRPAHAARGRPSGELRRRP
mmetsp:Transcript_15947/g.42146  ORF Transcript_15947/g.42146 Transcript_15947/m.42146 type:complete len:217 (-) Transcript_15947:1143-1793(-)